MTKSRKEVSHSYYMRKVKPHRRVKGAAKQLKMRCFMCGHWLDYGKYMEKIPSVRIDIKSWTFGGNCTIIVSNYANLDFKSREMIKETLRSKLKLMLQALNEPYEVLEPTAAYTGYQVKPVSRIQISGFTDIPLIKSTEISVT